MATLDVDIPTTEQKDSATDPKEIMEEDNEAKNGVIGDDRDEDKTVAETGPPTMAQPTDHPTPRLETGIVQQKIKRKEQKTLNDIDLDDIDNWLDNQTAIEYKPRKKSNQITNILDPQMMTDGKQDEDTKVLDFLPETKAELVDIGDTIRFMHVSHDRSSSYWLQKVLDKRIDMRTRRSLGGIETVSESMT